MQLQQKQPQSAAVVVAAAIVLVVLRVAVSTSFVNDLLSPVGQVGAWLGYQRPLNDNSPLPAAQLQTENAALRQQLELPSRLPSNSLLADVVSKNVQSYRQTIRINRGADDGVMQDDAVLVAGRLVGRVVSTSQTTAAVLLIGDPDFRAAVVIAGTESEGVLISQSGGLIVDRVNRTDQDLSDGQVVTSGLGGVFPPGLPVGVLGGELSDAADIFASYALSRSEALGDLRFVEVMIGEAQ